MNLYESIRFRYSCRNYLNEKIDKKVLSDIKEHVVGMFPLYSDVPYSVDIIDTFSDNNYLPSFITVKAPYYLCISTTPKTEAYINAGYILEYISLYLTSLGIATCILNIFGIKLMEKDGMKPVIILAFGKPKELAYRESRYAKRKPLEKLCCGIENATPVVRELLECARFAPSAFNSQIWRFEVEKEAVNVFLAKHILCSERLSYISIGCALANMSIAADEKWQDAHVECREIDNSAFSECKYACSVVWRKDKNTY